MEKMWKEDNRLKTRQKLIERHEKNIEKERKAGIYKDYQTLSEKSHNFNSTRNRPFTTANLIRNRRILSGNNNNPSGFTTSYNNDRKIFTAVSEQPQKLKREIFSQYDPDDRIISKRSEKVDDYQSQNHQTEHEDTKTIDRHNVEEVDEISSNNDQKFHNQPEMDELYEGDPMNDPRMDYYDNSSQNQNIGPGVQGMSEFRVSYSKPKFPLQNMTTERLAIPKQVFQVNNPFLYSE